MKRVELLWRILQPVNYHRDYQHKNNAEQNRKSSLKVTPLCIQPDNILFFIW